MSERLTKIIVDCSNNTESIIELTDDEIAQLEADRQAWEAEQAKREVEEKAKADARASALAKLAELGLTLDEAKAVLG